MYIIPEDDRIKNIHRVEDCIALVQTEYKEKFSKELCGMTDKLTGKSNEVIQAAVFDTNFKCENEVDISNVKPIDKTDKEHFENVNEELIQKIIDIERYVYEQQRKCGRGIAIDSKVRYASAYGTASFLDYVEAVKNGQIKIHDKKYEKKILELIKNNEQYYQHE